MLAVLTIFLTFIVGMATAAETEAVAKVDFARQVRPLLAKHCYACHGPSKAEAGLRLSDRDSVLAELESGQRGVVPGDADQSEIVRRLTTTDPVERMPLDKPPLSDDEIRLVRHWIEQGATWKPHWAFAPPGRPWLPTVNDKSWVRTPVDVFVLSRLEEHGLIAAPPADRAALIRRAYYDLTGLPPAPAEVHAFVQDHSEDAYQRLIDRLLASPQYGERWGRHWLDLVRYAESNSYERDGAKPFVWRYRDYVIESLNDDKPYDQFILEQLAGDELDKATSETVIATGYYRLGIWQDEPVDSDQELYEDLDDIVTTTAQTFLGLTMNCARCHDHKLDPIPQHDYYRFLAFFHGINRYGVRSPESVAEFSIRSIATDEERESQEALRQFKPSALREALCVTEIGREPRETFVLARGNVHAPGARVEAGFPSALLPPQPEIDAAPEDAKTCGRRRALARWIASAANPLTARVMANRIWQYHFGRGIVRSPNDFGYQGSPPTHPELLEWLAAELVGGGWRLKPVHRMIMLSSAYQMASHGSETALATDPENDLFWRFDMRRLAAEELRDSILAVIGVVNLKMGGPSIYPLIPQEVLDGQSQPGLGWEQSVPHERARRSVYVHVKRSLAVPLLASFDAADPDATCPVRFVTTQPTQALGMLNGDFLNEQAKQFAHDLRAKDGAKLEDQVRGGLLRVLQRVPTQSEVDRGLALIESLRNEHQLDAQQALDYFCLLMLNLNEFVYID